jgi:hypothetical protein
VLCTNGHNNYDYVQACRLCGVTTFVAPSAAFTPPPQTNGMAVASMVLGIVWLVGVGSVLALVFGYKAKGQIGQSGERGEGMATAGIVLGWVGIAGAIFEIFFLSVLFHTVTHIVHLPPCQFNCPQ